MHSVKLYLCMCVFYSRLRINYSVPSISMVSYPEKSVCVCYVCWPTTAELIGYGCGMRFDYVYMHICIYTHRDRIQKHTLLGGGWGSDDGGGRKIKWHVDDLILTWRENELTENVNGYRHPSKCVCVCVFVHLCHLSANTRAP